MNIPKLRFPEFSGEWEKKTFGEILTLNMIPVAKPSTEYERLGILCHNKGTFHEHIDDPSYIALDTLYKVHKDNFIVNITFAWEHAIAITTEKDEDALVTFRFLMFTFNSGYYHQFFKYAFSKEKFRYALGVASPGGAGRNRVLNQKQLNRISLNIPSFPEQQKIADFLSIVDSIIASEIKILNALQKKKKALMQKLFSQQLRFKADDGSEFPEWVEKKLGDCVINISSGKNKNKSATGNYPVYGSMGIIGYTENYKYEKDCILIARVGANAGALNVAVGKYDVSDNTLILNLQKNEILKFYYYRLMFMNLNKLNYGTGQPLVTSGMLQKLDINLPCKEEQQKIADSLSSMDSLIENQQKILTTWQQRKKALLQQMFV